MLSADSVTNTEIPFQRKNLRGIFSIIKGPLKPNLLATIEDIVDYFWRSVFNFRLLKTHILLRSRKTWENLKKWVSVSGKKISAPIPIPKLDLGFGSRYRNLVSVIHHFVVATNKGFHVFCNVMVFNLEGKSEREKWEKGQFKYIAQQ